MHRTIDTSPVASSGFTYNHGRNLLLNEAKTQLVKYMGKNYDEPLIIDGEAIVFNERVDFLGVTIDRKMTWKPYIEEKLLPKLNSYIFVLRRISRYDREVSLSAYHALFSGSLSYGIEVWGSCCAFLIEKLLKAQKQAIRAILRLPRDHSCREGFATLKILTVPALYSLRVVTHTHAQVAKGVLTAAQHKHNTRNISHIQAATYKTDLGSKSPIAMGVKLYNLLPVSMRAMPQKQFKSILKKHLLDETCYSLEEVKGRLPHILCVDATIITTLP